MRAPVSAFGLVLMLAVLVAGCGPSAPSSKDVKARDAKAAAAGLVSLPCDGKGPLRPQNRVYCWLGRTYVTPPVRVALIGAAKTFRQPIPARSSGSWTRPGTRGPNPSRRT